MDMRSWRYFLAIADAGSVAGAARQLRLAQPALSRQLTALEAELRMPLVIRHRRGITLTDAGVVLRDRARSLLRDIENVRDEEAAKATEPRGRLSIGIPPSLSNAVTVPLVESYCALYPKVELVIREGPTEDLAAELAAGRLDATLATMGEPTRHFKCEIVANDHMALVAPLGTRLPEDGVGIDALIGKRLIIMSNAGFMLDRLVYAAAQVGGRLDFALSVNSMTCLRLVEAGDRLQHSAHDRSENPAMAAPFSVSDPRPTDGVGSMHGSRSPYQHRLYCLASNFAVSPRQYQGFRVIELRYVDRRNWSHNDDQNG